MLVYRDESPSGCPPELIVSGRSLRIVKCPDCGSRLETSLKIGELIQCPTCDEVFRVARGNIVSQVGGVKETLARVAIPLGYVLFVGLPFAGLLYWVSTQENPNG